MRLLPFISLGLVSCLAAFSAEHPELKRLTPVPEGQPIPIIDFVRPARLHLPTLNPAGTHFAAILSQEDGAEDLLICDLATKKRTITTAGMHQGYKMNIAGPLWMGDRHLLYYVLVDTRLLWGLFSCDIDKPSHPSPLAELRTAVIISIPQKEPLHPYVSMDLDPNVESSDIRAMQIDGSYSNFAGNGLKSLSLRASVLKKYPTLGKGLSYYYMENREGVPEYALNLRDGKTTLYCLDNDKWAASPLSMDDWDLIGAGDEPGEIVAAGTPSSGEPRALYSVNAKTGKIVDRLHLETDYDLQAAAPMRRRRDGKIVGLNYHRQTFTQVWFDPEYKALYENLKQAFPQQDVRLLQSDDNEKRFVFSVYSSTQPSKYYILDKDTGGIVPIGERRPWIDPKRMRPMRPFSFVGRDGVRVDAYLTLPHGASRENLPPTVVVPHSSQRERDTIGWDPLVQFLASRGYAVLQVNYRGSWGYDLRWPKDERWAFHKMSYDVTDAVNYLIQGGAADRNRIGILGIGFGAHVALSAITNDPSLYACAATVGGIFDWDRYMKEARHYDYTNFRYAFLRYHLGDPAKEKAKFAEFSPLRRVDRIVSPMLVIYSHDDRVSGSDQGSRLANALKKAKVPYEDLMIDENGPGFTYTDYTLRYFGAIESFLAKNLPAKKPANN